ncbi:hypothetical protein [Succinimonas sp.]
MILSTGLISRPCYRNCNQNLITEVFDFGAKAKDEVRWQITVPDG